MSKPRLVLFTRWPEPGKAKTRLIPALGPSGAAALHKRLTENTVATLRASGLPIEVRYTGAPRERFADWLGGDLAYAEQGAGDLGERMRRASVPCPVIFVGGDCPDMQPGHLARAAAALADTPVVIGPAEDGGYWLIGLAEPQGYLFAGIAWGTSAVLAGTQARLAAHGIRPAMLETLSDCDRPEDLARWPELAS